MRRLLDRATWRRLAALLGLLAATAAGAPVTLAASPLASSGLVCRMPCCRAKAECCCKGETHASDEGADRAGDALERPSTSARCPEGCAQTAAHASSFDAPVEREAIVARLLGANPPPLATLAPSSAHRPACDVPRAPPSVS